MDLESNTVQHNNLECVIWKDTFKVVYLLLQFFNSLISIIRVILRLEQMKFDKHQLNF